jgi:hypothetical protein
VKESAPVPTVKATPQALGAGADSAPVPTLKESPRAKDAVESAPAATVKATPDAKTTARSPGAKGPEDDKGGEDRSASAITILAPKDVAMARGAGGQAKTYLLVAAVLLLMVLAYFGGLVSR